MLLALSAAAAVDDQKAMHKKDFENLLPEAQRALVEPALRYLLKKSQELHINLGLNVNSGNIEHQGYTLARPADQLSYPLNGNFFSYAFKKLFDKNKYKPGNVAERIMHLHRAFV